MASSKWNWRRSLFCRKDSEPTRQVQSDAKLTWQTQVEQVGLTVHDRAIAFLAERYRIQLDVKVNGFDDQRGFVDFAPENVIRFLDAESAAIVQNLIEKPVCPIGTTSGHTVFLLMDSAGASYAIDMDRDLFAPLASDTEGLLKLLCEGENCRVDSYLLDESGRPNGHVIRESNERDFWSLEAFPQITKYLPCRSLSPCRRPPTWRPVVKAAEQSLQNVADPSKTLITCGGFAHSPSGQAYLVSHCENSIYVRRSAGFQVSSPPPGVPRGLRPGECVPFVPPGKW